MLIESIFARLKDRLSIMQTAFENLVKNHNTKNYKHVSSSYHYPQISTGFLIAILNNIHNKIIILAKHNKNLNPLKKDLQKPLEILYLLLEKVENVHETNKEYALSFIVGTFLYALTNETSPLNEKEIAKIISFYGTKHSTIFRISTFSKKDILAFIKGFNFLKLDQEDIFRNIDKTALSNIFTNKDIENFCAFLLFFKNNKKLLELVKFYFSIKSLRNYDSEKVHLEILNHFSSFWFL